MELGFSETLVRLSHVVQHEFAEASRAQDLTPQQAQLLCVLIAGPVGMTDLSQALHLEKSSLTGLVDRVERRGLVARVPHEHDRRACRIALTDEGTRLAHLAHRGVTDRLDALTADVPPDRRALLAAAVAPLLAAGAGSRR